MRFDDTNPEKEESEYVESIKRDVRWLGFEWSGEPRHASSYFEQLYAWAVQLIEQGDALIQHLFIAIKKRQILGVAWFRQFMQYGLRHGFGVRAGDADNADTGAAGGGG